MNVYSFASKKKILLIVSVLLFQLACQKKKEDAEPASTKALYFASGACNVGQLTASKPYSTTSSGTLGKVLLSNTQQTVETIADYASVLGEFPVGLASFDTDRLIVGIETNGTNRRIDLVSKSGSGSSTGFASGSGSLATVFSTAFRSIVPAIGTSGQSDAGVINGFLISRGSAIEKLSLTKQRQFPLNLPTAPWVSGPGGSCATSTTNIASLLVTPSGKLIYTHSNAAQNRIGVINGLGYGASTTATADCLSGIASPDVTNSFPTALAYVPNPTGTSPQVLVYYSSSTLNKDYLYRYDYNDTTGVLSGGTLLYQNGGYLRGVSAMVYDSSDNILYLANGSTLLPNSIEKFSYDPSTFTLTRSVTASGASFIPAAANTQCINSLLIEN